MALKEPKQVNPYIDETITEKDQHEVHSQRCLKAMNHYTKPDQQNVLGYLHHLKESM